MSDENFQLMRSQQYCDNESCSHFQLVGADNIRVHSRRACQLYCNKCHNKFSVRKGTMFSNLRTPIDKIVQCLRLLASGTGMNAVGREMDVETETLGKWIILASKQVEAFSTYMQKDMSLSQVQIDEFWSYIKKKVTT